MILPQKITKTKHDMKSFSERYGYTKVSQVIIREEITEPVKNSIINWFYEIGQFFRSTYYEIEKDVWLYFLNRKLIEIDFITVRTPVILPILDSNDYEWYHKLNLIEFFLSKAKYEKGILAYVNKLNSEFERHNFAYRVVGVRIEEITSEVEIESIEDALLNEHNGVRTHIQDALAFLSAAQESPNYRSSIHQSISAVEACCREITNENTLGDALKKLEKNGVKINPVLHQGFDKIYGYSCGKDGIRHALMDDSNPPTSDEAIFMLIACSAFINYLTKKKNQII
jgi:hypothetical protein